MTGTNRLLLDVVEIDLGQPNDLLTIYVNVFDNSLSRKWLQALSELLQDIGFPESHTDHRE